MAHKDKLTEIQKAAERVRFARANHAVYGDSSSQAELIDAVKAFSVAQNKDEAEQRAPRREK